MRPRHLPAVALLLLVAACGARPAEGGDAPVAQDPLRGKTFLAMAVTQDGKPRELAPNTEVTVEFTDDGRLIARAGCNMMQGHVDTSDGMLTVPGGLAMTGMGCDAPRHDQDEFIANVLSANPQWELTDGRLTIRSDTNLLDLAMQDDTPRDLTGKWTMDTIVDGAVASSVPAGVPPVTVTFDGKKVVADTHCNGVQADYTVEGDTITFVAGASTLMACAPEIMQVEEAVADVLRDEVTLELTADQLTLTHPSGKGIKLRAE